MLEYPFLLRFLRANDFRVKVALEKFKAFINWRIKNTTDELINFQYDELDSVKEVYSHGYHKTCRNGRPVSIKRMGLIDYAELASRTTKERFLNYYIGDCERTIKQRLVACSEKEGRLVE